MFLWILSQICIDFKAIYMKLSCGCCWSYWIVLLPSLIVGGCNKRGVEKIGSNRAYNASLDKCFNNYLGISSRALFFLLLTICSQNGPFSVIFSAKFLGVFIHALQGKFRDGPCIRSVQRFYWLSIGGATCDWLNVRIYFSLKIYFEYNNPMLLIQ